MDILTNNTNESDQIALEDGEIDEIDEPVTEAVETHIDETDIAEIENTNGSDIEASDRLSIKSKKHKHHKKGSHRKRQLSTDELSTTDSWKRSKSGDEANEIETSREPYCVDLEAIKIKESSVEKTSWGHRSDEDDIKPSKKDDIKSSNKNDYVNRATDREEKTHTVENHKEISPCDKDNSSFCSSPVAKEKWGVDSDEEFSKPSESKRGEIFSSSSKNDWTNKSEDKDTWSSRKDDKKEWDDRGDDKKPWNNKSEDRKPWDNKSDDNKSWNNRNDDNKGWRNKNDDNKGWGNKSDSNKSWDNKNDDNKGWGDKNDGNKSPNNQDDGGNRRGGRNQDYKSWGSRNDDNSSSNQDDGNNRFGNRRGGRNNWGNRNEDGNNRGSRNSGRNNWRNRNDDNSFGGRSRGNDDNNSWGDRNRGGDENRNRGGRNKGSDDWNNGNRDSDSWSNKNKENDSYNNKSKENDGWSNKDNDSWGNKDKKCDSWDNKDKDNDSWSNKGDPENKEENDNSTKDVEMEEKQTWAYSSDNEDSSSTTATPVIQKNKPETRNTFQESNKSCNDSYSSGNRGSGQSASQETTVNEKKDVRNGSPPAPRDIDDFGKWGDYDSDDGVKKPKEAPPTSLKEKSNNFTDTYSAPVDNKVEVNSSDNCAKWEYDSDEATSTKPSSFRPQNNLNNDKNDGESVPGKWNSFNNSPIKKKWGDAASDDEKDGTSRYQNNDNGHAGRGGYNNQNGRPFEQRNNRNDNNRGDNYNRNDSSRNDNRNRIGGGGGGKKLPCKYFQNGTCRQGDKCTFLHDSPTKTPSQEPKIQELCRFYEHQECYKRNTCTFMHDEFPCKLFHVGAKMCPSGDSCKYSHAPLNPETRSMLERYLDEKIDERTDRSAKGGAEDMSACDPYFQDPMQRMYPQTPETMQYGGIRPWNPMMAYGELPVAPQMDFMQRQRFMLERFPHSVPGRMLPRFRGMMPNANPVRPMHEPFHPYGVTPLMPVYGHADMKERQNGCDPYIDNLAKMVVGPNRDATEEDAMDDFAIRKERDGSRRTMLSPLKTQSPEVPPGAYVPRTSMTAVQPNVRLGGALPYGAEAAMMFAGGYGGHHHLHQQQHHPGDAGAMLEYINMAAIHYYHNQADAGVYERPWKLIVLEVPGKVPYPLMNIDTADLTHKYIDPRLRGHPSVLHSDNAGEESALMRDANALSVSSLDSPLTGSDCTDMERQLSTSFQYRSDQDSPVFPISEDAFCFQGVDEVTKKVLDRSYLQDPRFKRKKANLNVSSEQTSEIE